MYFFAYFFLVITFSCRTSCYLICIEKNLSNLSELHGTSLVLRNLICLSMILPKSSSISHFILSIMLWYCSLVLSPTTLSFPLNSDNLTFYFPNYTCINFLFLNIFTRLLNIRRGGRRGDEKPERKGRKMPLTIVYVWRRNEAESLADYLVRAFQRS